MLNEHRDGLYSVQRELKQVLRSTKAFHLVYTHSGFRPSAAGNLSSQFS